MKVIHCCLSCFYIDGFSYQENELVREHVSMGHDVLVIASTQSYDKDGAVTYVEPSEYMGADGAKVIRLAYSGILPEFIKRKVRIHNQFYESLVKQQPDVIIFHGLCGWELLSVSRYKKNHPSVLLYADSHTDANNSGSNWLSYYLLHKVFYKSIIHASLSHLDKVLYITKEVHDFCLDAYNIPRSLLESFPLGGNVLSDEDYYIKRKKSRSLYGITSKDILFVQTGKINSKKKLFEALSAFSKIKGLNFKYIIAGVLSQDVSFQVKSLISKDVRISEVGWKSTKELEELLCAADVYVQPGSQSATMQMSLCARCPVILDDVSSHRYVFRDNGWLVSSQKALDKAFKEIESGFSSLSVKSKKSYEFSKEYLDYKKLAQRIVS